MNCNTERKEGELDEEIITVMSDLRAEKARFRELMERISKGSLKKSIESLSSIEGNDVIEDASESIVQLVNKEREDFNKRMSLCEESFCSLKAKIAELADKSYEEETSVELTFDKFLSQEAPRSPHKRVISEGLKQTKDISNTIIIDKRKELEVSFCKSFEEATKYSYSRDQLCGKCIVI